MTAQNGEEALAILNKVSVDVVVSDVRMPVMGGVALAKALATRGPLKSGEHPPKIVLITAYADVHSESVRDLGVDAVLHKPFLRTAFLDTIHNMLRPLKSEDVA